MKNKLAHITSSVFFLTGIAFSTGCAAEADFIQEENLDGVSAQSQTEAITKTSQRKKLVLECIRIVTKPKNHLGVYRSQKCNIVGRKLVNSLLKAYIPSDYGLKTKKQKAAARKAFRNFSLIPAEEKIVSTFRLDQNFVDTINGFLKHKRNIRQKKQLFFCKTPASEACTREVIALTRLIGGKTDKGRVAF